MAHTAQPTWFIGVALALLAGCDGGARRDFGRPTVQSPSASPRLARSPASIASPTVRQNVVAAADLKFTGFLESADREEIVSQPLNLVGRSEGDIRARFGAPASEEDRTPGKVWRYRHVFPVRAHRTD